MPEMRRVFSSHIDSVGYDEENGELTVKYSNGAEVVYTGVPAEKGRSVLSAPSIGQELWRSVRGQHDHHYRGRK